MRKPGFFRTIAMLLTALLLVNFAGSYAVTALAAAPTSYTTITVGLPKTVTISTSGAVRYFRFVPTTSDSYTFYSAGSYDAKGALLDASGTQLSSDDDSGPGNNFTITYKLVAGATYYLAAGMYGSGTGSYTVQIDSNGVDPIETEAGTKSYVLFNSGSTVFGGNYTTNYNTTSLTNGGYDIYVTYYATLFVGVPFKITGEVTEQAFLSIKAFDVDEGKGESDMVYLVDETANTTTRLTGILSGQNEQWNTTKFSIDPSLLVKDHVYKIKVSETTDNWHFWIRNIDLQVTVDGGEEEPEILGHTFEAAISSTGLVSTALYLKSNRDATYRLEYAATNNSIQYGSLVNQSINVTTSGVTKNASFQLESGAPEGNYQVDVTIRDANDAVVAIYTVTTSGPNNSTVNYDANGGSNNLPVDYSVYRSGDTVTVKFNYVPSKSGYIFAGWATSKTATRAQYTESGTKTFVIGESDVTLYAVWQPEHSCSFTPVVTAPGCETKGYTTYTCSCGDSYVGDYTEPVGHNYQYKTTVEPTCTADGYMRYSCTRCGDNKDTVLHATGHEFGGDNVCDKCGFTVPVTHTHDYKAVVTAPTCTGMGYTTYTCSCGASYKSNYIDQTGHKWNEGAVTKAATCTADGIMTYTCTVCSETMTEVIPAGHDWEETVTKAATCTTDGSVSRVCKACGETETEILPAGHKWDEGTVTKEPTCTEPGTKTVTCTACGATEVQELETLGHEFRNGTCVRCGAGIDDVVVPDYDHTLYGMYFRIRDIVSNYGRETINEYGVFLDHNPDAKIEKVAVYLTQEGNLWRRAIACVGSNITYATYVPYLSYNEDIKYTGLNSSMINIFRLSENRDGIWCYSDYTTIGVNLEDSKGNLLLTLSDIGQAGKDTRIFTDLDEMIAWLKTPTETGDFNSDGVVDANDVDYLLWHTILGADLYPVGDEGDLNGDGVITGDDVILLLLHVTMPDMFPLN